MRIQGTVNPTTIAVQALGKAVGEHTLPLDRGTPPPHSQAGAQVTAKNMQNKNWTLHCFIIRPRWALPAV